MWLHAPEGVLYLEFAIAQVAKGTELTSALADPPGDGRHGPVVKHRLAARFLGGEPDNNTKSRSISQSIWRFGLADA